MLFLSFLTQDLAHHEIWHLKSGDSRFEAWFRSLRSTGLTVGAASPLSSSGLQSLAWLMGGKGAASLRMHHGPLRGRLRSNQQAAWPWWTAEVQRVHSETSQHGWRSVGVIYRQQAKSAVFVVVGHNDT